MFGTKSGASDFEYKLGEVNVAKIWNPKELDPKKMGGFNFSTESKILRCLVRGNTIYDVELPEDAELVDCPSNSAFQTDDERTGIVAIIGHNLSHIRNAVQSE